jgi:hypothetical protein
VNSRDIREALRGRVDPRLGSVLIALNEDVKALRQQMMKLAELFDQLADNQIRQANAVNTLRMQLPYLKALKEQGQAVGSDPSITGENDRDISG